MTPSHPTSSHSPHRRGMLLLVVLSMLTLFALMGTLALVIATRARASARAFATASGSADATAMIAASMADEALLTLIRGSKDSTVNTTLKNDNLLKDMYGTTGKGRFVDEPWDAFDNDNQFLTQLTLHSSGTVQGVPRPAFGTTGTTSEVDNDGDGIADSIWLKGVLPTLALPDGDKLEFRVAYLVLDLDARLNVNAHGKPGADSSPPSNGPADLDASPLLTSAVWNLLLAGTGGQLLSGAVDPSVQWRKPPPVGSPVDGRFGAFAGANNLKNQLEYTYAIRLDLEAVRPGVLANAAGQNPFTLGELERVLRQFDDDASTLPPRLAAILHDRAERSRLRITTDSWDTPGTRYDIRWEADNSGVNDEKAAWAELWPKVVSAGAPEAAAKQWVANVLDFRDTDNAETNFDGGIKGVEPNKLPKLIPGTWNDGRFQSFASLLAVPKGTESEVKDALQNNQPLISLAKEHPKILELMMVPFFHRTLAENPNREPARINVNTCDNEVWKVLIGSTDANPFATTPAKNVSDLLLNVPLVFADASCDVSKVNHTVASRLANVATTHSHVFAIWITLEAKNSGNPDQPTYHRLFAIVDRSIPVTFTAATEGTTTPEIRNTIRLKRFLN